MAAVSLQNISKRYGASEVVRDLNLVVDHGEFVTLVGPSGCGKTTVLRMVAGLEDITSGHLYIGRELANHIAPKARGVSMVFQSYALFPHMTVSENIAFGLKIKKYTRKDMLKRIAWAVDLLGLKGLEERLPRDLSGGQRQRVAFARAAVVEPEVLLLDEPLSNLDATLRLKMRAELKRIHKRLGTTIIYVTHDQIEAMSLSDRLAIMREGELAQVGRPKDVYNAPRDMFVAGFIGSPSMNFLNGRIVSRDGGLFIDLDRFQLAVPEGLFKKCQTHLAREVVFAIRPEHIYDKRCAKTETLPGNTVDMVTEVVDPLGDRDMVQVSKEGVHVTLLLEPETETKPQEPLTLVFDMAQCHIFDKASQKSIIHTD
ncbi:MAG: ABC transporter ATP-binding protein [Thermodesulfobacteriota bacterium]|nr:ABC transporter ATP-binding protein [Thermodesulfobacteriota bacterium]